MPTISTTDFAKGKAIIFRDEPWIIVNFEFVNPGKGSAFVRTNLKNLKTQKSLSHTFKSGETMEEAPVSWKKIQYLYNDGENFYFMDQNYEQFFTSKDVIGDNKNYLIEQAEVQGVFLDETLIDINLPKKMDFKVISAPPGVKGDSATSPSKFVEIETGAQISVPIFIKEGDIIKVNTEKGEYSERVNK